MSHSYIIKKISGSQHLSRSSLSTDAWHHNSESRNGRMQSAHRGNKSPALAHSNREPGQISESSAGFSSLLCTPGGFLLELCIVQHAFNGCHLVFKKCCLLQTILDGARQLQNVCESQPQQSRINLCNKNAFRNSSMWQSKASSWRPSNEDCGN